MKKHLALTALAALLGLSPLAQAAGVPVVQPYRALGETTPWTVEGQLYGLMKVRVTINGQIVAEGPLDGREFTSTYRDKPVRVRCPIHTPFLGKPDWSCSVYYNDELATNLVFVRSR